MEQSNERIAMRVSRNSIIGNVLLTVFKLFAGIAAHSSAMVSDAIHSLSDVLSTFIVIAGIKMANRKPDKDHPYGHERLECVAAILLAAMLFGVGLSIGWGGVRKIFFEPVGNIPMPGTLALIAAATSIVVKEAMYHYTRLAAKKINSSALTADAWHHRSDAFSSIGSFAGIFGARLGFPVMDAVASVVICAFILWAAVSIFRDAVGKMTDKACDEPTIERIRTVILEQEDVEGIDTLRTRLFGDKVFVDVEIRANGSATLETTHRAAQRVHDAIETQFPQVKHCMVHVNPDSP